jgi:hypothetical protein
MNARFILIAAATLTSASAFAAEPAAKPPAQQSSQPEPASAHVLLASADDVRSPAPVADQQAPTQPKRRLARVTTCRCGDQQAQPDQ